MKNGEAVAQFEAAFAEYVGAEFAIAMCNGTATLHTALVALGVKCEEDESREMNGDVTLERTRVAVPPLTMASTTIAVLHAGGVPVFVDVDPDTWLMRQEWDGWRMPVSLYGLHWPGGGSLEIDDAAQTLRPHGGCVFTSYSFQASKILPLGEGGMLVTNDEELAVKARDFSSLGYRMQPTRPIIDKGIIKHPNHARHFSLGYNYRMSDLVAEDGLGMFGGLPCREYTEAMALCTWRQMCADMYREAITGCPWIIPQHVPEGWQHDYWAYAVALESAELWEPFTEAIVRHGGEMPYGAWRLTYQEPAFRHLAEDGCCPVAEDLQPRLVQMQTNCLTSARKNADALALAIREIDG